MTRTLSEKRAADRTEMAKAVEELARRYGCEVERCEGGAHPGPRCIQLALTAPGDLQLTVDFDGHSCQPDTHVLSWHMAYTSKARLRLTFAGSVNPHHRQKATVVAEGFEALMTQLEHGLRQCHEGTAYE